MLGGKMVLGAASSATATMFSSSTSFTTGALTACLQEVFQEVGSKFFENFDLRCEARYYHVHRGVIHKIHFNRGCLTWQIR